MDFNMPIMDGIESTQKIREYVNSKNLKQPIIIGCTGHVENQFVQNALRNGINLVMAKPLDGNRLQ